MSAKKDFDNLVQYTAERLTHYIETPKEQRKRMRLEQAQRRENWSYRWFGMLPYAIKQWVRGVKVKKE